MTKFMALLAAFALSVSLQIIVMIYGWGLSPRSWWVIILVGVFGNIIALTIGRKVIDDYQKS